MQKNLWENGARLSLRGALLKMGIQKGKGDGNGNGNGEGKSKSNFMKQRSESTVLVATLIATVTFAASFTVPGGYKSQDGVDEGSAVLSKKTSFEIFLIANSAAFGLSLASVFSHFTASKMILDFIHRKKFVARAPDSISYSTTAMLLAFILGNYTVVPHNMGITVAVIVCWCFFSSYITSLLRTLKSSLSLLVSSPTQKKNKQEVKKNGSTTRSDRINETRTMTATAAGATETTTATTLR